LATEGLEKTPGQAKPHGNCFYFPRPVLGDLSRSARSSEQAPWLSRSKSSNRFLDAFSPPPKGFATLHWVFKALV